MVDPYEYYNIPEKRKAVWEYYKLSGVADDGYPLCRSKLVEGMTVAHPIIGPYMIIELINSYANKGRTDDEIIKVADRIASAAFSRMSDLNGAKVFQYHPNDGITPYQFKFTSALTQARYLGAITKLYEQTGDDKHRKFCKAIAKSFGVHVEEGGVLLRNDKGCFLEEYPTEVPTYVLNGWITVLNELFYYCYKMNDVDALKIAKESTKTLIEHLPMYDMPEMLSSRYKLAGQILQKVQFSDPEAVKILEVSIHTDGKTFNKDLKQSENYGTFEAITTPSAESPYFTFKHMLSMMEYPKASTVLIKLQSSSKQTACWNIAVPRFEPRYYTPKAVGLRKISEFDITIGEQEIKIEVPWDLGVSWVGTAVPFSKFIAGKYYNAYHYIHVKGLTQLYQYHKAGKILHFRDRWLNYTADWSKFTTYSADNIELAVLDKGYYPDQDSYLLSPQFILSEGNVISRNPD